jgi:LacI family transcriptional regulator
LRATIRDVAKRANVSIATVSNVLTSSKYVSDELRQKILESMEELGYEPNVVARSLKINKTFRIGVIVPDITNPFFSEIVKAIEISVNKGKYQLIVCNSDYELKMEIDFYNSFIMGAGVDALILVAPRMTQEDLNKKKGVPVVIVDRPPFEVSSKDVAFVYADNYIGASMVASLFLEKKYKRFACIAGPETVPNANIRYEGFKNKLVQKGVRENEIEIYRCEFSFDEGYAAMGMLLENYDPSEKMAVFVCSDIAAWGAIEAAKAKGLEIPNDIGIAGYDNIYFAKFIHRGLTTVENPTKIMGDEAGNVILRRLKMGETSISEPIVLKTFLIERNTV